MPSNAEFSGPKKYQICVIGAVGFIASHLSKRLKEQGNYVVSCDWRRNAEIEVHGSLDNFPSIHLFARKGRLGLPVIYCLRREDSVTNSYPSV